MITVVTAARLHLLTWRAMIVGPWAILATSLAINLVVEATLSDEQRATTGTGGLVSIYFLVAIWAVLAVTQGFPFALGFGITRRSFAAGTAAVLTGQALVYAAMLTALRFAEGATDGFGLQLRFFRISLLRQETVLPQLLVYAAPFLLFGAIALAVAVIYHRWRQTGLFLLVIATILAIGGVAALVTWSGRWASLTGWFGDQSPLTTLVLLPVVAASAAALAGFAALRRATP